jgi:hypothetical protein
VGDLTERLQEAAAAAPCAWCSAAIPAGVRDAHVVHAGEHRLPTCGAGCLAELVAIVAGVRLGLATAARRIATVRPVRRKVPATRADGEVLHLAVPQEGKGCASAAAEAIGAAEGGGLR